MLKIKRKIKRLTDKFFYLCFLERYRLKILRVIFNFNKWHINGNYYCRPYKRVLLKEINKLNTNNKTVVEVGGGLGDIISRINSDKKYLIDLDSNLEKVIKILHSDLIFVNGSLDDVMCIQENDIDILILVNWIHNIETRIIIEKINNILSIKNVKFIVLDEVNENISGYEYKHNFENAINRFKTFKLVDDLEGIRKFRILKCKN